MLATPPADCLRGLLVGRSLVEVALRYCSASYLLELAIIAASYFGIAKTALLVPAINATAMPLWPPTGVALSVILLRGDRVWPAILIGSIFASAISSSPTAFLESASSAIATTVAALAGAWLINRWSQG